MTQQNVPKPKIKVEKNMVDFKYILNSQYEYKKYFEELGIKIPVSNSIAVTEYRTLKLQQFFSNNISLCGGLLDEYYVKEKSGITYGTLIVSLKNSNKPIGISIFDIIYIDKKPSLYIEIFCSKQPDYSHVGTVMMEQLFEFASINNFEYITLDAVPSAVGFYEGIGFEEYNSFASLILGNEYDDLIPMRINVSVIKEKNTNQKKGFFENFADRESFYEKIKKMNPFRQKHRTINLGTTNQTQKNPPTNRKPMSNLTVTSRTGVLGGRKNTKRKRHRSNKTKKTK